MQVCSNQLPYSWNGHSYNAAGIYADTISGGPGCDSIASLHLLVKPVVSSVANISTCSNQLPFNWNGQSYSTAGTYHVTLTGSNGCDSIATLNLFVKPVVASNNNISVCNNQLPFSWNGNSYNSAGNYSVTLTGSNGCDSIANLALRIKSVSYSTTNIRTCSNQLPVSWNGQQFSTAGTHQVNLVNAAGCDSIATLILSINPVVTGNSIASTCSNHLPFHWNGQSYSTPGVHVVTLQSAAGCDSIATLQLTINPVQSSLTQVIVCNNQLPYFWNGHSYDSSGNFTVTLNSVLGCDSLATLKLIVNRVSTSTTTANVCSAALPYNWNGQSYTTDGIHTVTLTNAAGCDSVATLDLSVQASPGLPIVNSPVKYCQFDSTSALVAAATVSPASLSWFNVATGGIASANAPVPSSALAGTTNYYVSQSSGLCQGPRALITVKVNGKPNLGPDKQQRICFGAFANLNSYYTTNGNQLQWTNGGSLVPNPSAVQLAGIYQLIATTSFGCVDTANLTLQVQPPVVANAGPDANVEPNIPYQLQGSGGGEYQWSPASLLNNPFISSPLASISSNTSFILTVEDEIGCTAFDTVNLRVLNGPTFYVPTAFTPNGDGQNDIFRPTPVGISSLDYFKVFNRYGELVFETHELGKGWDGRYKGVMQNTGNFVWWIKGTDRKGDVKLLKGNVVLIR